MDRRHLLLALLVAAGLTGWFAVRPPWLGHRATAADHRVEPAAAETFAGELSPEDERLPRYRTHQPRHWRHVMMKMN
jgi:hypothetical protein